jgi:predicted NACHT family NTPase
MTSDAFASEIKKTLIPILSDITRPIKDIVNQTIYNRILEYVIERSKELMYTKTMLTRAPVLLNDIYYHLRLKVDGEIICPKTIDDYFETSDRVLIIGDGGGGKTTLINYTFINSYKSFGKIPILYNLREIGRYDVSEKKKRGGNNVQSNILFTALLDHLLFNKIGINDDVIIKMFETGKFIFILEGFDELPKKHGITVEIKEFIQRFSANRYLITTRRYSEVTGFSHFIQAELLGLDINDDIEPFIRKQLGNNINLSDRIIAELTKKENSGYVELLTNPLFLILFINSFEYHPSLPKKKAEFYYHVFDALYGKHDSWSKDGFERPKYSVLSRIKFEEVLQRFSFTSFFEEIYEFTPQYLSLALRDVKISVPIEFEIDDYVSDLKESIPIMVEVGLNLKFIHRTIQEYFTALFIVTQDNDSNNEVMSYILGEDSISPYLFLLELISELNEKLYIEYFLLPYIKKFFEDYNDLIAAPYAPVKSMGVVLSSYLLLLKLIGFSETIQKDYDAFVEHRKNNYSLNDKLLLETEFEELHSTSINLLILSRSHQVFLDTCLNTFLNKGSRNKKFIHNTLYRKGTNQFGYNTRN